MIKILLVDDNAEICEYFKMVLDHEPSFSVVGCAHSGREAVKLARMLLPDVVLMDIQMETDTAGIAATAAIKKQLPQTKVIILTIHTDDELLFQAYQAGVVDFITKTDSIAQIITSIHNAYQNQLMLRSDVAEKIVTEYHRVQSQNKSLLYAINTLTRLTNSEFEVLKSIYEGNSYKQIADARFVAQSTIKSQVNSILKKFELTRMKDVMAILREIQFEKILNSGAR